MLHNGSLSMPSYCPYPNLDSCRTKQTYVAPARAVKCLYDCIKSTLTIISPMMYSKRECILKPRCKRLSCPPRVDIWSVTMDNSPMEQRTELAVETRRTASPVSSRCPFRIALSRWPMRLLGPDDSRLHGLTFASVQERKFNLAPMSVSVPPATT